MDTLDQLNAYSSDDFEVLLDTRLRAQYGTDSIARYRAWDLRELGIPFGESHIDQVVALFKKLSINGQGTFCDAAAQLLRHARPGEFPPEAMADLILLVGLVRAYAGIRAFVPVIGSGPWGELHRSLFYDALSVLLMFDRSIEAYDAAKGLATSLNFPEAYVFDAYVILVRSQPEKWSEDLMLMRERFFGLQRRTQLSGDSLQMRLLARRQRDLAGELIKGVPLSELARQLSNLQLVFPNARDGWLVDNLSSHTKLLRLEYSTEGDSLRLMHRSDSAEERVRGASELEVFCIRSGHLQNDPAVDSSRDLLPAGALALLNNISRLGRDRFRDGRVEDSE